MIESFVNQVEIKNLVLKFYHRWHTIRLKLYKKKKIKSSKYAATDYLFGTVFYHMSVCEMKLSTNLKAFDLDAIWITKGAHIGNMIVVNKWFVNAYLEFWIFSFFFSSFEGIVPFRIVLKILRVLGAVILWDLPHTNWKK